MFGENLKTFRKQNGFSQEQLSVRLNVVRQTISKWEKNLSVPDAEMLIKISEVLNVSISDLLGKNIETETDKSSLRTIALELEKLNELLTTQQTQRTNIKTKMICIAIIVVIVLFVASIYDKWNEIFYEFGKNVYHWLH